MQWIVLLLSSIALVMARPRSGTRHDFGLESFEPRRFGLEKQQSGILWSPRYPKDLFEILNHLDEKRDGNQAKIARKRALSALTRWKPFASSDVEVQPAQRVPSRAPMISMVPDINFISAESAEAFRNMGKPLRWGKKR